MTVTTEPNAHQLQIEVHPVPLRIDQDSVVRVGGTRVTLDTIVSAFENGATAEEIAISYPALQLADIYAVISYYLRHRTSIQAYLQLEAERDAQTRREVETEFNLAALRERLLGRQPTTQE